MLKTFFIFLHWTDRSPPFRRLRKDGLFKKDFTAPPEAEGVPYSGPVG